MNSNSQDSRTGRRIKNTLVTGAIAVALMAGFSGCGQAQQKKTPPVSRVVAKKAIEIRLEESLLTTGDVLAMNTVELESTAEGPISFCPWREGDLIDQPGQKLIEITRPLYKQELAVAEAVLAVTKAKRDDLKAGARPEEIAQANESMLHFIECTDFAKEDLNRISSLVESGTLPVEAKEKARVDYTKCKTQFESAKEHLKMLKAGPTRTELAIAQASVSEAIARRDIAQAKLNECLITAPFAGIITEVYVRPGDMAVPRQPLLKIIDPKSLVIRVGLPENCSADLHKGTVAKVQLDAYPGKTFNAEIERIYPRLENASRTRLVELRVTDPVALIPRMFARVSLTGRIIKKAIVVPSKAIVATPRGDHILFVAQEGTAIKRRVTLGLEQGDLVQILKGVQPGELVIVEGNLNLKKGAKINVAPLESTEVKGAL